MERNMSFSAQQIKAIRGKMTWGQVEIVSGAHDEVQLLVSGDDESVAEVRVEMEGDTLYVGQPQLSFALEVLPRNRWLQVFLRIPKAWRGGMDIDTVNGLLGAYDVQADDMELSTISGGIVVKRLSADMLKMRTVSGAIAGELLTANTLRVRTTAGDISLGQLKADEIKTNTVSGKVALSVLSGAKELNMQSVAGSMAVDVEDPVHATLGAVTGQLMLGDGVVSSADGLRIAATSISGGLVIKKLQQK